MYGSDYHVEFVYLHIWKMWFTVKWISFLILQEIFFIQFPVRFFFGAEGTRVHVFVVINEIS